MCHNLCPLSCVHLSVGTCLACAVEWQTLQGGAEGLGLPPPLPLSFSLLEAPGQGATRFGLGNGTLVAPVCRWWRLVNCTDKGSSKELALNGHSGLRMEECGALLSAPSEPLRLSSLWHPAFLRPLPPTPSLMPELRAGLTCPRGGRGQCHTRCMTWPGALGLQGRAHCCVCQVRGELPGVGGRPLPPD